MLLFFFLPDFFLGPVVMTFHCWLWQDDRRICQILVGVRRRPDAQISFNLFLWLLLLLPGRRLAFELGPELAGLFVLLRLRAEL